MRTVLLRALEPYPEARVAVSEAMRGYLVDDLRMALDPVAFAAAIGFDHPDPWQAATLRSPAKDYC